jgi:hypothetical protein
MVRKKEGEGRKDDAKTRAAKDLFVWVGKHQFFLSL